MLTKNRYNELRLGNGVIIWAIAAIIFIMIVMITPKTGSTQVIAQPIKAPKPVVKPLFICKAYKEGSYGKDFCGSPEEIESIIREERFRSKQKPSEDELDIAGMI